jgi:hypothetical protein
MRAVGSLLTCHLGALLLDPSSWHFKESWPSFARTMVEKLKRSRLVLPRMLRGRTMGKFRANPEGMPFKCLRDLQGMGIIRRFRLENLCTLFHVLPPDARRML